MVSIAAFQAVDPGSIPGHRICFDSFTIICIFFDSFTIICLSKRYFFQIYTLNSHNNQTKGKSISEKRNNET